jgi:transcriptional regulator of arginine metabolism
MSSRSSHERRDAIRRIIRLREVGTQEELAALLAEQGFEVNQATISRDLAEISAVRISRPDGGSYYGLEASAVPQPDEALRAYGAMVYAIQESDSLVVIHTQPGAAPAVARAVDLARTTQALGTIAGDDTIFVAGRRGVSARALCKRLKNLFGKED